MNKLRIVVATVLLIIVAVSGYFIFTSIKNKNTVSDQAEQTGQVLNPDQQATPETQLGTGGGLGGDQIEIPKQPSSTGNDAGCKVGGCSGQLCLDAAGEEMASTCEWKDEYSCYKQAKCEKQSDGKCGWTKTAVFKQCLAKINPSL